MSAVSLIVTPLFCNSLPVVASKRATALSVALLGPTVSAVDAAAQVSVPEPLFCKRLLAAPCADGNVSVWLVVVAPGCSVSTPLVEPLSATVLTPAMSAVSLIVTPLFCSSLPVVASKRATALSVALLGPVASPALAHVSAPAPLFFK